MSKVDVYKSVEGSGMKRPWYARIDGKMLRKSNGVIVRYKDATAARAGANREIERLRKLAVTMASRMHEASDFAAQNTGKP